MPAQRYLLLAAVAATMALLGDPAAADHRRYHDRGGRVHFGITLGAPLWYPGPAYYHPFPLYTYPAYPPAVVYQSAPSVYIERDDQAAMQQSAPAAMPYWYFCRDSNTYYPYVKECASPWERVPARPVPR